MNEIIIIVLSVPVFLVAGCSVVFALFWSELRRKGRQERGSLADMEVAFSVPAADADH